MTLNDIRNEVCALGFEDDISDSSHFLYSVRRALSVIFAERSVHAEAKFYKSLPPTKRAVKKIFHTAGKEEYINADEGAYSFYVSGGGSFTLSDADGEKTYNFTGGGKRFSGFIKGGGVFRFFGDYCFSVYSFYLFPNFITESASDIPTLSGYEEYNLSEIIPDYFSSLTTPTDSRGEKIRDAEICSGIMKIPSDYEGEIKLTYKKSPPRISLDEPDTELPLPSDILHLLPLLTAAYIWLDDDTEKAYYYMSLYREGIAAVKRGGASSKSERVIDTSGWAPWA